MVEGFGAGLVVVGATDDGTGDGVGSSRSPLREARSSEPRAVLGVPGVTLGDADVADATLTVSVAGPRVMAAAAAATTTVAAARADTRGNALDGDGIRCFCGAMELFGSGRADSASACLPDKIQTFRRRQAAIDGTERCSGFVKLICLLCCDLRVIFRPIGGDGECRTVRHPGSVRRTVNLDRGQLITLLGDVVDPTHAACQAELTAGATFRLHDGTVSRESVLRTYATRIPAAATHEALRRLAMCAYSQLRLGAVSGNQRFVIFMDPDAHQVVACLDVSRPAG